MKIKKYKKFAIGVVGNAMRNQCDRNESVIKSTSEVQQGLLCFSLGMLIAYELNKTGSDIISGSERKTEDVEAIVEQSLRREASGSCFPLGLQQPQLWLNRFFLKCKDQ